MGRLIVPAGMKPYSPNLTKAALIVIVGIAVRLVLLLIVDPVANQFTGDTLDYFSDAHRIAAGLLPSSYRPPLYPIFLLLTPGFTILAQCALTIFSGVAAYKVLGGKTGFWTGLLIAACPFFAFYDFRLLSESLYVNLIWWAWLALHRKHSLSAGFLMGLAILTRDTLFLLPLFALLLMRSRVAIKMCLAAYLLALPWAFYAEGRVGLNLWIGTWERTPAWFQNGLDKPQFPIALTPQEKAAYWKDDPALLRAAIVRMKTHPFQTAENWVARYPRLWIGTRSDQIAWRFGGPAWVALKVALFGLNLLLLLLGFWGLRASKEFAIPVVYTALIYIPFHNTETRYSLAALTFLIYAGALVAPRIGTEIGKVVNPRFARRINHSLNREPGSPNGDRAETVEAGRTLR
jgi:hypothetical protein